MKLEELKKEIQNYQYFEDTGVIDVSLASIIASRLKLGDPVWLIIIGPSSGGKSQILRPLALTDTKFMHRLDDLTENTFLSGAISKGGKDISLLNRIGPHGVMIISDLTVLFSKNSEAKATILSQFRMLYDGEMIKYSGTKEKPITWKGYMGVLAGSTPSIYTNFEEVSDMGERFVYWRMKDFNPIKATSISLNREISGKDLDEKLANLYTNYLKDIIQNHEIKKIPENIKERIIKIALLAERIRTSVHVDWQREIIRLPVMAMPMRVSQQLMSIAKGLSIMRTSEDKELTEEDINLLEWCGYSLANEEKRACLKILAMAPYGMSLSTSTIGDYIGLSTDVTRNILQNLAATEVITRDRRTQELTWYISDEEDLKIIRKLENIKENPDIVNKITVTEEKREMDKVIDQAFRNF